MRDRPVSCPRCNVPLVDRFVPESSSHRYRCRTCRGAAISAPDLVAALQAVAPELVPAAEAVVQPAPEGGRREPPLACPCCGEPMEPIVVARMSLDRCPHDRMLWFDDWEHVTVLAAARDPDQKQWLEQLLRSIIPHPDEDPPPAG